MQILTLNICRCIHVGVSVGIGHATRKWGKGIKEWGNSNRMHVTKYKKKLGVEGYMLMKYNALQTNFKMINNSFHVFFIT